MCSSGVAGWHPAPLPAPALPCKIVTAFRRTCDRRSVASSHFGVGVLFGRQVNGIDGASMISKRAKTITSEGPLAYSLNGYSCTAGDLSPALSAPLSSDATARAFPTLCGSSQCTALGQPLPRARRQTSSDRAESGLRRNASEVVDRSSSTPAASAQERRGNRPTGCVGARRPCRRPPPGVS